MQKKNLLHCKTTIYNVQCAFNVLQYSRLKVPDYSSALLIHHVHKYIYVNKTEQFKVLHNMLYSEQIEKMLIQTYSPLVV